MLYIVYRVRVVINEVNFFFLIFKMAQNGAVSKATLIRAVLEKRLKLIGATLLFC
jgi:hypothetical protein